MRLTNFVPKKFKSSYYYFKNKYNWKGNERIFCISHQKTGTTSVGDFFVHFGYPVVRSYRAKKLGWNEAWYEGDFEKIFQDPFFKSHQVFEDSPFWYPEFYKVLYHHFPNAKFILFTRNSEDWFNSLFRHGKGFNLGNTWIHAKIYRREQEFYHRVNTEDLFNPRRTVDDSLLSIEGMKNHYTSIYDIKNKEVKDFFQINSPENFFCCDLADPMKWQKLGEFTQISIPENFVMHSNKGND